MTLLEYFLRRRPAKVGTTASRIIVIAEDAVLKVGEKIGFRDDEPGSKWERGLIDKINPDGYLFVERL